MWSPIPKLSITRAPSGSGCRPIHVWASASGLLAAGIAALRGARIGPDTEMPFGPFLAAGLWLAWLYGPIGM